MVDGTAAMALRAMLALMLVVGLILAAAWLLRRVRGAVPGGGWFRVRAAHAIGPRDRVLLVEAAGAHLLLSVSAGGVRLLHAYDEAPELPATGQGGAAQSPFAQLLARRRPDDSA